MVTASGRRLGMCDYVQWSASDEHGRPYGYAVAFVSSTPTPQTDPKTGKPDVKRLSRKLPGMQRNSQLNAKGRVFEHAASNCATSWAGQRLRRSHGATSSSTAANVNVNLGLLPLDQEDEQQAKQHEQYPEQDEDAEQEGYDQGGKDDANYPDDSVYAAGQFPLLVDNAALSASEDDNYNPRASLPPLTQLARCNAAPIMPAYKPAAANRGALITALSSPSSPGTRSSDSSSTPALGRDRILRSKTRPEQAASASASTSSDSGKRKSGGSTAKQHPVPTVKKRGSSSGSSSTTAKTLTCLQFQSANNPNNGRKQRCLPKRTVAADEEDEDEQLARDYEGGNSAGEVIQEDGDQDAEGDGLQGQAQAQEVEPAPLRDRSHAAAADPNYLDVVCSFHAQAEQERACNLGSGSSRSSSSAGHAVYGVQPSRGAGVSIAPPTPELPAGSRHRSSLLGGRASPPHTPVRIPSGVASRSATAQPPSQSGSGTAHPSRSNTATLHPPSQTSTRRPSSSSYTTSYDPSSGSSDRVNLGRFDEEGVYRPSRVRRRSSSGFDQGGSCGCRGVGRPRGGSWRHFEDRMDDFGAKEEELEREEEHAHEEALARRRQDLEARRRARQARRTSAGIDRRLRPHPDDSYSPLPQHQLQQQNPHPQHLFPQPLAGPSAQPLAFAQAAPQPQLAVYAMGPTIAAAPPQAVVHAVAAQGPPQQQIQPQQVHQQPQVVLYGAAPGTTYYGVQQQQQQQQQQQLYGYR
ncbi:hypothetical protein JCM8097_002798 [Rhodosporidiobolus ruineniae]